MKKLFAVLALVAVISSCNNKKKDEKKPDATTTTTTTDPNTSTTTTTTTTTSSDVPTFADAEVQQYVNDYTAFVTAYVDAYKAKDYTKIADMGKKMSDWSARSASVGQKLAGNAEEATKFSNYVTKLSEQLTAAMQMK
ncbi:MAG TPA: hypothetical protein VIV35_12605 [Chitinophagaceae bacterium]